MTIPRFQFWSIIAGSVAMTYPLVDLFWLPFYPRKEERRDRTIIVTGATGTVGVGISYHLALRKARVIMACRDLEKCKMIRRQIVSRTGHHGIACRHLDLEDIDSINNFADDMIKNEPHIDVLINNAAVKKLKEKEITKYGIEKHYWVNFLAPFLLTFKLLPKLKESAAQTLDSRIVNVIGKPNKRWDLNLDDINFDKRKYSGTKAYCQSKLALAYFTIQLNKILKENREYVYVYGTNPSRKMLQRSKVLINDITYSERLWTIFESYLATGADRAAQPSVHCTLDPRLGNRFKTGQLYGPMCSSIWGWGGADNPDDEMLAKQVWNHAIETLLKAPDYLKASEEEKRKLEVEVKKLQSKVEAAIDQTGKVDQTETKIEPTKTS